MSTDIRTETCAKRCWVYIKTDGELRCPVCGKHINEEYKGEAS